MAGERGLVLCVEAAGAGGRWEQRGAGAPAAGQRGCGAGSWAGAGAGDRLTWGRGTGSSWELVGVGEEGRASGR